MRKMLVAMLAAAALFATDVAAQSERQLLKKTKDASTTIWPKAKVTAFVDEHDFIVEFRVPESETEVRESFHALIDLISEYAERHEISRGLYFSPGIDCSRDPTQTTCSMVYYVPLPRPRPNEFLPSRTYRIQLPKFAHRPPHD